ncbi:MAG: hypothetical protein E7J29_03975 [Veillonella sp.]|uniref:hypothetical protein n=1 Tax=Veillonella sp. TaxID=1926307 RepID=UPI00290C3657|nr:hypothetical protein [Veillonella sp.]MDU7875918.1 hypothetical protein [Veillonella sp.]MDU7937155.1 hypothetical protein [Veillonella sp.]
MREQELIINSDRGYSNIDEWIGLVKLLVPILTRSDNEGIEVDADANNVSPFSPVSSVINNAPKNFATGTLTYVGENAFGKTVEKAYLSVSKPMNNNIRVRDAKMLGGKAYNVGMFGNSFNENNERYNLTTEKVVSTTLDSVNLSHDLELIKTKPKIKASKNKLVNMAKIITFKLSKAGIKGTAIDRLVG